MNLDGKDCRTANYSTPQRRTGFEILITADKNIRYQQNLTGRKIALIVIGNAQWPILRRHLSRVMEAADAATHGSYVEVVIPA